MFTGIIEELGEVVAWEPSADAARLTVRAPLAVSDAGHGDSIAVNGLCLTVVDQGRDWFTADVMGVSIAMSTFGGLTVGRRVNLERAAQVGDRLGGHIVQGHIDGTSTVLSIDESTVRQLYHQNPAFGLKMIDLVAGRLSADIDRLNEQLRAARAQLAARADVTD